MSGRLDWTELLFSSAGRLSRAPFLLAALTLVFVAALYEALLTPPARWVIGILVYPFLLFCGVSITAKRLHDRGRSGWWASVVLAAVAAVWTLQQSFLDFLFLLVLVWAAIELGAMPGEQGANRYGPNPLRPATA
jgi:uncharacterized membrane protein YhaH (DUF805 family)